MKFKSESSRKIWLVALAGEVAVIMSFVTMVSTRGMSDLRLIQALLDGGLILLIASLVTLFAASIGLSLNGERWGNRGVVRAGAYLVMGLAAFAALTFGWW